MTTSEISQRTLILEVVYSKPMVQQPKQNNSQVVKMVFVTGIVVLSAMAAIQVVKGQELLNTATNKIEFVDDMGKRDALEEIMVELDQRAADTESTFILVEQPNEQVTLFTINYPYEDYAETDLPMKELGTYELMELLD